MFWVVERGGVNRKMSKKVNKCNYKIGGERL